MAYELSRDRIEKKYVTDEDLVILWKTFSQIKEPTEAVRAFGDWFKAVCERP
jgi:hypothetical protein